MKKTEEVVQEIKASKKYKALSTDTIRDVVGLEIEKHNSIKNAKKSAKKKLHLILAAYLSDLNYAAAAGKLQSAFSSVERPGEVRDTCLYLMERHASTRERIAVLDSFYNGIFNITGKPGKIADLACALNPFSFRWMGLPTGGEYHAFDNNADTVELLNLYFGLEGLKPQAELRDILCCPPETSFDVGFLFKMYHCLEHRRKGAGWQVIENTPAKWLAVSFPNRNLSSRKVDIFSNYKDDLLTKIKQNNWEFHFLEFDPEIVLVIHKGSGSPNP